MCRLRILDPEREHWRRGIEAAVLYAGQHGDLRVPFTYRAPVPASRQDDDPDVGEGTEGARWSASLAGFPPGQWIADARRQYARGQYLAGPPQTPPRDSGSAHLYRPRQHPHPTAPVTPVKGAETPAGASARLRRWSQRIVNSTSLQFCSSEQANELLRGNDSGRGCRSA